jgi:hypothetical protein
MYTVFFISFWTTLAVHVSGAICTHYQEHNCTWRVRLDVIGLNVVTSFFRKVKSCRLMMNIQLVMLGLCFTWRIGYVWV